MKDGQSFYKSEDQSSMMRDVIDLIGINLKFAKRLTAGSASFEREVDAETRHQLNNLTTSGNAVISRVLENINTSAENEQTNPALLREQWLKLFEITTQLVFSLPAQGQPKESLSDEPAENLLQRFHSYFLSFAESQGLSEQARHHREGIQLSVYPSFLSHLQSELHSAKKFSSMNLEQQMSTKAKAVDLCLDILGSILNGGRLSKHRDEWQLREIEFAYANGILNLLQSDGDKLHETEVPALKNEDLEG